MKSLVHVIGVTKVVQKLLDKELKIQKWMLFKFVSTRLVYRKNFIHIVPVISSKRVTAKIWQPLQCNFDICLLQG